VLHSITSILEAERQVQRRAKSASVSETTLRVRCNVCSASLLFGKKHNDKKDDKSKIENTPNRKRKNNQQNLRKTVKT